MINTFLDHEPLVFAVQKAKLTDKRQVSVAKNTLSNTGSQIPLASGYKCSTAPLLHSEILIFKL